MTAPATTSPVVLAGSAKTIQMAIQARLLKDVATLWPSLDPKRLDQTFPGWIRAMILLITNYHGQSSAAAAAFYRMARADAIQSPTPAALIQFAQAPAEAWLTKALGFAGPGMLSRDDVRPGTALSTTLGTSGRIALDGGRTTILNTVQHDRVAVGWYRVTDGDPCAFCALLASRGAVYKEDTVGFQAHNLCGCSAAPAFSRDQELPEISKTAARVYRERGKGPALVAFRKAWAEHQAASA